MTFSESRTDSQARVGAILAATILAFLSISAWGQTPASMRDLRTDRLAPGAVAAAVPRGYALVVGVGRYEHLPRANWLRFSESDADAMYRVLISQRGGAFPAENVHKLIGADATLANVRRELEQWLPSVARANDRVVVYFAGHGIVRGASGYLAPYDLDLDDVAGTGLPMREIGEAARKLDAHWKAIFLDACHSAKVEGAFNSAEVDRQIQSLPPDFLTFSATREREQSFEDPQLATGFGVFTYYLTRALSGEAESQPCDGLITADELIDYVRNGVQQYARSVKMSQTPTEHGDFDNRMVLGANPSCVAGTPAAGSAEVYLDGNLLGRVSQEGPLSLPGIAPGFHAIKGVRAGYEPELKEILIVAGEHRSVKLRVQYRREYRRSAVEEVERGEDLLFKRNSSVNPLKLYGPGKQRESDLQRARVLFTEALADDPQYTEAAHYLALACQQLSDYPAMKQAFRRAIVSDPSYVPARVDYAGALIEDGDPDEAIRQLLEAIRLDASNDLALSHIARAYLDKEAWPPAIDAASKALSLNPSNYEAHLWKADALRRSAPFEPDTRRRRSILEQALDSFAMYAKLTAVHTRFDEAVAFYAIGFHLGSRKHSDRQASYGSQRSMGLMGMCDVERQLGRLQQAVTHCAEAGKNDPAEPLSYFFLANAYRDLYNATLRRDYVLSARKGYARMVELNPDLPLSRHARDYMEQIDSRMALR